MPRLTSLRLGDLGRDLRFGARALRRTPGFTIAAIASLALGLALTTTTLAIVNAYLLRSMPYPAAHRLYRVMYAPIGQREPGGLDTLDWMAALGDVLEVADSSNVARFYLTEGGVAQEAAGLSVARGSAESLGVRATQGRPLQDQDYRADAERVAMIGHSLWRTRFGSDPQIVGRLFRAQLSTLAEPIDTYRIVGILPPEFRFVRGYHRGLTEIVVPLRRPLRTYLVRLREGVPVAHAERRITTVVTAAASSLPPNWTGVRLESVHAEYVRELRPILIALTVAASLVLAIVCANVAVLVLLRAMRRQKEISVRVSLGAGRLHIVRMLAAEAALICGTALALGLALTASTLRLLAPVVENYLGRSAPGGTGAMTVDPIVLAGVGGVGLLLALSLAGVPLLTPWQRRLAEMLRRDGRSGTDGPSMRRLRASLVALEVAGSLALLVGCGLMIRSVVNLVHTDLGYETRHVVRARIGLPARTYPDAASFLRFYDRFAARLAAAGEGPFALANFTGFYPTPTQRVETDGPQGANVTAGVLAVSDGLFDMLRIPIRQGRAFTADDRDGREPVAVISETLARRLWPDGSALGRRIRTADQPVPESPLTVWRTVIGVAGDVRQTYTDDDLNDIYLPFFQAPSRYAPLYARTEAPLSAWVARAKAVGAEIDRQVLIDGANTLDIQADALLAEPRFVMWTMTGFAIFAALLALLGIYGVTAYAVQQREREVAIRMALGATGRTVVQMFLTEGLRVIAVGLAGGLLAATAVARLLEHQLHGVRPVDVSTLVATCGVMTAAAFLATWWPARRAAARNPIVSLNEP